MIELNHGTSYERALLNSALSLKGLTAKTINEASTQQIVLKAPNAVCNGALLSLIFLDERHPLPQLFQGTPEQRAMMRSISDRVITAMRQKSSHEPIHQLLESTHEANPFLLDSFSVLDLLLLPIHAAIPNQRYARALNNTTESWTNFSFSSDLSSLAF